MEGGIIMRVIEKRTYNVLQLLLAHKDPSLEMVMSKLDCTERQLTYDIKKLNDILEEAGKEGIRVKRRSIILPREALEVLESLDSSDSSRLMVTGDNKAWLICVMVFCAAEPIGLNHFITAFNTSRSTAIGDIKKLSSVAAQYRVGIKYTRKTGYHFTGKERNIRTLVLYALSNIKDNFMYRELVSLAVDDRDYPAHYDKTRVIVEAFIKEHSFPVIKEYLEQSILFISIMHYHCKAHAYQVAQFNEHFWLHLPMYDTVTKLYDSLPGDISRDEIEYLFVLMVSMTLGDDVYFQVYQDEKSFLMELSHELTNRFEVVTGTMFPDKEKVSSNIFLHLQPAYFRLKYGIPVINPILAQIKKDYGDIFAICRLVLEPFSDYVDCFIPDDEVAYIAIHFLAMLDSPKPEKISKQAVVVCQNGLASSVIMKNQLTNMFPELIFKNVLNIEQFYKADPLDYDVVFTSSELEVPPGKHKFMVSPLMGRDEKFMLSDAVYSRVFGLTKESVTVQKLMGIVSRYAQIIDVEGLSAELARLLSSKNTAERKDVLPLLKDLLTQETIQFKERVSDWEEAIRLSAQPLLDNGAIDEVYIQAMIDNVKEHGPYIVLCPYVAIPHAQNKEGVNKLGMSYLKLENEVNVLDDPEKPVKLLITLAAIDSETHLKALAQLSNILSDTEKREELVAAASLDKVLAMIEAAEA